MSKILKNNTGNAVPVGDIGEEVPASGQLTVPVGKHQNLAISDDVITLIGDGTLTYNDGTNDLGNSDAIDHIKGYQQKFPLDADGFPIMAPTYENNQGLQAAWEGNKYVATKDNLNIFDILITAELKAQGGWYELTCDPSSVEATLDDVLECEIIDKDDRLGMFDALQYVVGTDVLSLGKFLRNEPINPWACNVRQPFLSAGTFDILGGLYFRFIYDAKGTVNDVCFKTGLYNHET